MVLVVVHGEGKEWEADDGPEEEAVEVRFCGREGESRRSF